MNSKSWCEIFILKLFGIQVLLKHRKLFLGDLNNKSTEYVDKNTYFVGDCFVMIVKLNREVRKVILLLFVMN